MKIVLLSDKHFDQQQKQLCLALENKKKYTFKLQPLYQECKKNIVGYATTSGDYKLYPLIEIDNKKGQYALLSEKHLFFFNTKSKEIILPNTIDRWILNAHGSETKETFSPVKEKEDFSIDFLSPSNTILTMSAEGMPNYVQGIKNNLQEIKTYGKKIYKDGLSKDIIYTDKSGMTHEMLKKEQSSTYQIIGEIDKLLAKFLTKLDELDERESALKDILKNCEVSLRNELENELKHNFVKYKSTADSIFNLSQKRNLLANKFVNTGLSAKDANAETDISGTKPSANKIREISLSNYGVKENKSIQQYLKSISMQLDQIGNIGIIGVNPSVNSKLSYVCQEIKDMGLNKKLCVHACRSANNSKLKHTGNINFGPSIQELNNNPRISQKLFDDSTPSKLNKISFENFQNNCTKNNASVIEQPHASK